MKRFAYIAIAAVAAIAAAASLIPPTAGTHDVPESELTTPDPHAAAD